MGTKSSKDALGAAGKKDVLLFDPEDLVIVEDPASALYDERATMPVDEPLVLNIMHHGVLEPILVRKNQETGKVEVVAGRQRVKACREANKRLKKQGCETHRVPAVVKRGEGHALMGMMISENEHREDDSPLVRAKKVQRFLDMGRSEEEAAVMFGVSVSTIKNMVALLDAPKVVQRSLEKGEIGATDAYKLAKLEPEEAEKRIEQLGKEAPRQNGKKRRSNGKKAKAIIEGSSGGRGKREILALQKKISETESMKEMHRIGALAILGWALGDDKALDAIL